MEPTLKMERAYRSRAIYHRVLRGPMMKSSVGIR
jgi:hypothetical protein